MPAEASAPRTCRRPAGRARPRRARRACRAAAARRRRADRARGAGRWRSPGALPGIRPAAWSTLEPSSDARRSGLTAGAESRERHHHRRLQPVSPHRELAPAACPPGATRVALAAYHRARAVEAGGVAEVGAAAPAERVGEPVDRAAGGLCSTHCWTRIVSPAARAVSRGRRPPSQVTLPVIRGERIRCHSNAVASRATHRPAASRGCRPGPRAPRRGR